MRTFIIQISILASIFCTINLTAQPIITYTGESNKQGFSNTYSLHEAHVNQVYTVYKEIKQKDSEVDIIVYELFRMGLIALFKKNPQKTQERLDKLRFAVPVLGIFKNALDKKMNKATRKVRIDYYSQLLVNEVISTIVEEKMVDAVAVSNY